MSLSLYTQEAMSKLFSDTGAFFAFSNQQFSEKRQPGVQYSSLGAGLIVPVANVKTLVDEMDKISEAGIAKDLEANSKETIILRELNNFECFYTGDITDCCDALKDYGITAEEIKNFFDSCQ
jgi:hypothetical protein